MLPTNWKRLSLQTVLQTLIGVRSDGGANVYFQPPASVEMNYPAIVYSRDKIENTFADNQVYKQKRRYSIIVIDPNPDSTIAEKVSKLPTVIYDRGYQVDNLNHDAFKLYY